MPSARALPAEFVLQAIPYLGGRPANPPHKAHEKLRNDVDVARLGTDSALPTLLYHSGCYCVETPESNDNAHEMP